MDNYREQYDGPRFYLYKIKNGKRGSKKSKRKKKKKKPEEKTNVLVMKYSAQFPTIDLNTIYSCVLQHDKDEREITKYLSEIISREEQEKLEVERMKQVQEIYPLVPLDVIRKALKKNRNSVPETLTYIIEKGHVKEEKINIPALGKGSAKKDKKRSGKSNQQSGVQEAADPTLGLVRNQNLELLQLKDGVKELQTKKKVIEGVMEKLERRVKEIAQATNLDDVEQTLREEFEKGKADDKNESKGEEEVEWGGDSDYEDFSDVEAGDVDMDD